MHTDSPTCARHPKVVTYLTCATCGTPICPDCFVQTPVGYKCRACGRQPNSPVTAVSPLRALAVLGIGLLGGLIAGLFGGSVGFFLIWLAVPYGNLVGSLALRASGGKVGTLMEVLTGAAIVIGGLTPRLLALLDWLQHPYAVHAFRGLTGLPPALLILVGSPFSLLAIFLTAAVAVSRLRNLWGFWRF